MEKLKQLLNVLESMKSYRPRKGFNRFEVAIERCWRYGLIAAAVPFGILCGLAGWHNISALAQGWVTMAIWCAILSQVIAALSLLCPPLLLICNVWFWKENARALRDAELDHDLRLVNQLGRHGTSELMKAKHHLELKTKRLERRMGYFIDADAKKFAIFSLLILNYTIGNMLSHGNWQVLFSASSESPVSTQIVTIMMAFLFGVSIGAIFARVITNRDAYRIELIELALASR